MDSRNFIKEPVPEVQDGRYLEKMYDLQKELLEYYINGKENLPRYPININPKENQQLLKDFIGRVIEEMAECHQELESMQEWITNVLGGVLVTKEDLIGVPSQQIAIFKSHWQDMGEEIADTLHFFLELMIYSNIYPEDINKWIDKAAVRVTGYGSQSRFKPVLDKAMALGIFNNDGEYPSAVGKDLYSCFEPTVEEKLYLPMRYFKYQTVLDSRLDLWDVTQCLNMARNKLKNRPWKNSEEIADAQTYQSKLVEAFVYYMGYISRFRISDEQIYRLYVYKNRANIFRLQSNY